METWYIIICYTHGFETNRMAGEETVLVQKRKERINEGNDNYLIDIVGNEAEYNIPIT